MTTTWMTRGHYRLLGTYSILGHIEGRGGKDAVLQILDDVAELGAHGIRGWFFNEWHDQRKNQGVAPHIPWPLEDGMYRVDRPVRTEWIDNVAWLIDEVRARGLVLRADLGDLSGLKHGEYDGKSSNWPDKGKVRIPRYATAEGPVYGEDWFTEADNWRPIFDALNEIIRTSLDVVLCGWLNEPFEAGPSDQQRAISFARRWTPTWWATLEETRALSDEKQPHERLLVRGDLFRRPDLAYAHYNIGPAWPSTNLWVLSGTKVISTISTDGSGGNANPSKQQWGVWRPEDVERWAGLCKGKTKFAEYQVDSTHIFNGRLKVGGIEEDSIRAFAAA